MASIQLSRLMRYCIWLLALLTLIPFLSTMLHIKAVSHFSLFPSHPKSNITIWSSDFHISPVADIKNVLHPFGASLIDKSLSGHCHLSNTCERDLKVIAFSLNQYISFFLRLYIIY